MLQFAPNLILRFLNCAQLLTVKSFVNHQLVFAQSIQILPA